MRQYIIFHILILFIYFFHVITADDQIDQQQLKEYEEFQKNILKSGQDIDSCKNFLYLMKLFSKENPASVFTSSNRFIECSSGKAQSVDGYSCCQQLDDGKFFILDWPNQLHSHEYENLYVPTLKQGICLPDFCTTEDIENGLQTINDIFNNMQLDFWITSGNDEMQLPVQSSNSTNSTGNSTGGNSKAEQYDIYFDITDSDGQRSFGKFPVLFGLAILILITPIALFILTRFKVIKNKELQNAFNYENHYKELFYGKLGKNNLNTFNLVRIYGVIAVFLIHSFQNYDLASNYHQVVQNAHSTNILFIYFFFQAVDIFLFMGGFFQAISWAKKSALDELGQSCGKILKGIYQRFLRVWPIFFILLILYNQIYYHLGNGPIWALQESELDQCDSYMWGNMFFIDNLISVFTWKCFGHSWYLSVDFQLYSVCLVALFFYAKNKKLGYIILYGLVVSSLIYNIVFCFYNDIRALDISDLAKFEQFTESTTYYTVGMYFYRKPWSRAPLFICGLLLGISYQNKSFLFSQEFQKKLQETHLKQVFLLFIGTIVMFLIFFPMPLLYDPYYYSNGVQSFYFFLMPILTIALMVFLMTFLISLYNKSEKGYLNTLCNNRITSILAKISFVMYLSHIFVIRYFIYSSDELQEWSTSSIMYRWIGNFLLSCILCIILHLYYEAPISKLIAKKRVQKKNEVLVSQQKKPDDKLSDINSDIIICEKDVKIDSVVKKVNVDRKDNFNELKLNNDSELISDSSDFRIGSEIKMKRAERKQKYYKGIAYIFIVIIIALFILMLVKYNQLIKSDQNLLKNQYCSYLCKTCDEGTCQECLEPFELYTEGCFYKEKILTDEQDINNEDNSIQYELVLIKNSDEKNLNYMHGFNYAPVDTFYLDYTAIYHKAGLKVQRLLIDFKDQTNFLGKNYQVTETNLPYSIMTRQGGIFSFLQSENYAFYDYDYLRFIQHDQDPPLLDMIKQKISLLVKNDVIYYPRELVFYIDNSDLLEEFINISDKIYQAIYSITQSKLVFIKFLIDTGYSDFKRYPDIINTLTANKINYFIILPQINKTDYTQICDNGQQMQDTGELYDYQQLIYLLQKRQEQLIVKLNQEYTEYSKNINLFYVHPCSTDTEQSFLNEPLAFSQDNADLVRLLSVWTNQSKLTTDKDTIKSNILFLQQNEYTLKQYAQNLNNICSLSKYQYELRKGEEKLTCFQQFMYEFIDQTDGDGDQDDDGDFDYYKNLVYGEEEFNDNPDTFYHYDKLSESYGAKCLAGDEPKVQYRMGKYKQRWILLFQGAGQLSDWSYDQCGFDELAKAQASSDKGAASKQKSANVYKIHRSPLLDEYNMLFMFYCDGSLFQGSAEQPYNYDGKDLWFRGENNTIAYIQHAIKNLGLADSRQIVIYGTSSGGTAVTVWANYIFDEVRKINPYVDVRVVSDGGMFMDYKAIDTDQYVYRDQLLNGMYKVANKDTPPPNKECVQHYSQTDETWKCLFPEYNFEFIYEEIPILFLQSAYDFINIPRVGKIFCVSQDIDCVMSKLGKKSLNKYDLDLCNQHQKQYIQKMRDNVVSKVQNMKSVRPSLSAWVISCLTHDILPYSFSDDFQVPQYSGNTSKKVLYNFLTDKDYQFFEIDPQRYPNNYMCAGKSP